MIYGFETVKIKTLYFLEDKGLIALDSNDSVTLLSRFYYILWGVIAAAVLLPTLLAIALTPNSPAAVNEEVVKSVATAETSEKATSEKITETAPVPSSQASEVVAAAPTSNTSRHVEPASAASTAGPVKLSRNGICHAPGTTYYNQTKRFTAYDSLDACLGAGGRMPKR